MRKKRELKRKIGDLKNGKINLIKNIKIGKRNLLQKIKKRVSHNGEEIEDGPTKSLLAVMERTNYRAPNDWSGFRALTEK